MELVICNNDGGSDGRNDRAGGSGGFSDGNSHVSKDNLMTMQNL